MKILHVYENLDVMNKTRKRITIYDFRIILDFLIDFNQNTNILLWKDFEYDGVFKDHKKYIGRTKCLVINHTGKSLI